MQGGATNLVVRVSSIFQPEVALFPVRSSVSQSMRIEPRTVVHNWTVCPAMDAHPGGSVSRMANCITESDFSRCLFGVFVWAGKCL
jgi:hypothetical protein